MDLVEHCSLCFQRAASALAQGTLFADMRLHMWEGRREEADKRTHFVEVSFVLVLKTLFLILVVTQRDVFLRRKRLPEYQLIPISPEVSPIMQRAAAVFGNVILWYVETKHRTTLC